MINVFDVRTGKVMRDFRGSADEFAIGGTGGVAGVSWPIFRFISPLFGAEVDYVCHHLLCLMEYYFPFPGGVVEKMTSTLLKLGKT